MNCSFPTLGSGVERAVHAHGEHQSGVHGNLEQHRHRHSGRTPIRTPNNNSATAVTTVTASADLSVNKTGPATANAGTNITYTIVADEQRPVERGQRLAHRCRSGEHDVRLRVADDRPDLLVHQPAVGRYRHGDLHDRLARLRPRRPSRSPSTSIRAPPARRSGTRPTSRRRPPTRTRATTHRRS